MSLPPITACRSCGGTDLVPLLDLGLQFPVDFPATPDGMTKPASPVEVMRCPICTLVQLRHTVPAEWRYRTYWYRSAVNETMVAELTQVVAQARRRVKLNSRSVVLDIGANDGTLCHAWAETATSLADMPFRIAVEPATNLYDSLRPHAEAVHQACFPTADLDYLPDHSISVITSIAMAYGADDLPAFIQAINRLLKDDGLWVVQFQDLLSGMQTTAVDYLVHEHLMWFSVFSFLNALEPFGLKILDVEPRAINGGSLRLTVGRRGIPSEHVAHYIFKEAEMGIHAHPEEPLSCWPSFMRRVALIRAAVPATVHAAVEAGCTVDMYGASTKGTLLLQLCGLDSQHIRSAVERQPQKVGRFVGATGIPIVSEEMWRSVPGELAVLAIYQFKDAVLHREAEYLARGGQFLVPIPHPEIVCETSDGRSESFKIGEDVA